MKTRALIVLADGFEDIEAITPIDVLTRVGVEVTIAGLQGGVVKGAYGTTLVTDMALDDVIPPYDAIIFPGGRRNAEALARDTRVRTLVQRHLEGGKVVAAICAAPSHVLAEAAGVLRGLRATGDPLFNDRLSAAGAIVTGEDVTVDGQIVTARGPGAAMEFAIELAKGLGEREAASDLERKWRLNHEVSAG